MILPGKHLSTSRALLGVGAEILGNLSRPRDVSALWEKVRDTSIERRSATVTFDWFTLALTMLYAIKAVDFEDGLVRAVRPPR